MVYSFQLIAHANIRYREAVSRLARCELLSMLNAFGIDADIAEKSFGAASFLCFESRELTDDELSLLSLSGSFSFYAALEGALLRPLSFPPREYLQADLPEVLKYKGKTSVPFTRMMLNTASALTPWFRTPEKITVLDPMCGKGTTCFCALQSGMNAIGLDTDRKSIAECRSYFLRYLKYHMLKHAESSHSETIGKHSLPVSVIRFADTKEHYRSEDTRSLSLACGDASLVPALTRGRPVHVLVADLPYGIQHAPQSGGACEGFLQLLDRVLPVWKHSLAPGGAIALSFNTFTLPSDEVRRAMIRAGFSPCDGDPFLNLAHEVEQAVNRDVVFAKNC